MSSIDSRQTLRLRRNKQDNLSTFVGHSISHLEFLPVATVVVQTHVYRVTQNLGRRQEKKENKFRLLPYNNRKSHS